MSVLAAASDPPLFTMLDATLTGLAALVASVGTILTMKVRARRDRAEDRTAQARILAEERAANTATTQAIIDQLQEERKSKDDQLNKERAASLAEREKYERRIDQFWGEKAVSRLYVNALQDHIWQRKDPPPPNPPEGYVP